MRRTVFEMNYERLLPLISGMNEENNHKKLKSSGYMDLVVEWIGPDEYSIAHYYQQNGDLMRDPEMTVRVYPTAGYAEALTYQMDAFGTYQVVYPEPGKYVPLYKRELNNFLGMWLRNIKAQGFLKAI